MTFVATANAVSYCGATPHFTDISETTLGLDPEKLDKHLQEVVKMQDGYSINKITSKVIRAVVPMHTFGHPVELDKLVDICDKYNLVLVEDAAESLGSYYKGKHTGRFGRVSATSFNGNKIMTTGGGAILTDDIKLADYAKHLTIRAKKSHQWLYTHDEIGYNYRMPNINAALGCAQLEYLNEFIQTKRALTVKYESLFSGYKGIKLFKEHPTTKSNYWLQTLILDEKMYDLEGALEALNKRGIMARPI